MVAKPQQASWWRDTCDGAAGFRSSRGNSKTEVHQALRSFIKIFELVRPILV